MFWILLDIFVLGMGFLGQCLSINLSTMLRKALNDELEFSSNSGSDGSFQLILSRSLNHMIILQVNFIKQTKY